MGGQRDPHFLRYPIGFMKASTVVNKSKSKIDRKGSSIYLWIEWTMLYVVRLDCNGWGDGESGVKLRTTLFTNPPSKSIPRRTALLTAATGQQGQSNWNRSSVTMAVVTISFLRNLNQPNWYDWSKAFRPCNSSSSRPALHFNRLISSGWGFCRVSWVKVLIFIAKLPAKICLSRPTDQ